MISARVTDVQLDRLPVALPEPLAGEGVKLLVADGLVALGLTILAAPFEQSRQMLVTMLATLLVAGLLGRYRRSIAPQARDEWYATVTQAAVAALALFVVAPLFEVPWYIATAGLVLWTVGGSVAAQTFTAHRRGTEPAIETTPFLTAADRRMPRNALVRGTIGTLDFLLAGVAAIVLSPVIAVCALAIAVENDGPVLFFQRRVGVDGREFVMLKFRTMKVGANNQWVNEEDERITRVGRVLRRSSLDELPQLWNVLRGEMSLVGPRPEMSEYADRFVRTLPNYEDRQSIPPGITGWAQIQYDRNFAPAEFENVLPYDLFYVAHYSVSYYLFCLVKTAFEVFRHRAI